MSDSIDKPPEDAVSSVPADLGIDYPGMVQDALRCVVRDALAQVAELGMPGEHHFYISFLTQHRGVGLSDALRAKHPDEMTIVLQHDFRDLEVDDDGFDVTLRFGGVPQSLRIPLEAVTAFFDPSVHFMLRFEAEDESLADPEEIDEGAGRAAPAAAPQRPTRIPTEVLREADASTRSTAQASSGPLRPRAVDVVDDEDGDETEEPAGEVVSFEAFRRK